MHLNLKKNDPTRCNEIKERIKKTTKTQVKANRFSLIFLDRVPIEN